MVTKIVQFPDANDFQIAIGLNSEVIGVVVPTVYSLGELHLLPSELQARVRQALEVYVSPPQS